MTNSSFSLGQRAITYAELEAGTQAPAVMVRDWRRRNILPSYFGKHKDGVSLTEAALIGFLRIVSDNGGGPLLAISGKSDRIADEIFLHVVRDRRAWRDIADFEAMHVSQTDAPDPSRFAVVSQYPFAVELADDPLSLIGDAALVVDIASVARMIVNGAASPFLSRA